MSTITSGPMFEPAKHSGMEKIVGNHDSGAHYSVWHLDSDNGRQSAEVGMQSLRQMFPSGECNEMNFVLFSTSGVHGCYTTIEEIEEGFAKYGEDYQPDEEDGWPEGWNGDTLTVLIVHPRIVCLRCGNVRVRSDDIPYLKKLRETSQAAMMSIGMPDPEAAR
ncbi:hypothetical protein [Aminobacter sp. MDW-2]|uniref:hypothetical protein n=1 Tax=Aminobacter sp. MDW-2 TaxID=2666139 RepID=UPI001AED7FF6|nr:hypothetical protein [Aminobacter sp. MDW-2]